MNKTLSYIALLVIAIFFSTNGEACTTAVISGKYTKDGRPLLWKNRDTNSLKNSLGYFEGGKYSYLGLVNSSDTKGKNVWMGMNNAGFAIMNSATYNLSKDSGSGGEGVAMREALEICESLEDFEKYLDDQEKPFGWRANFGVIDAYGGAAYYEVGPDGYVKFDANDPKTAPFGYIIRANYSFTGELAKGSSGYIRYHAVDEAFYLKQSTVGLGPKDIEQGVTKDLYNSLTKRNLFEIYADVPENNPRYEVLKDYIPRTTSSSSTVIQGVMKGENPNLATMWSNVGFPLASVMVPTWIESAVELPYVVRYNNTIKNSPVCYAALKLKNERILNIRWGKFASRYLDVNALFNKDNSGIAQIIKKQEDEIYSRAEKLQSQWRKNNTSNKKEIKEFYKWVNNLVIDTYNNEFDIDLNEKNLVAPVSDKENQNSMKGVN
ncbi:MAG: carcinine hydrolase/isopenicillin-N N-acyltransferase family protein [Bacteroidota bacterium]